MRARGAPTFAAVSAWIALWEHGVYHAQTGRYTNIEWSGVARTSWDTRGFAAN